MLDVDECLILNLHNPCGFHAVTLVALAAAFKYLKAGWNTK